jgi:hypothetical protein
MFFLGYNELGHKRSNEAIPSGGDDKIVFLGFHEIEKNLIKI